MNWSVVAQREQNIYTQEQFKKQISTIQGIKLEAIYFIFFDFEYFVPVHKV